MKILPQNGLSIVIMIIYLFMFFFLLISNLETQIISEEGMKKGGLSMAPKHRTLPKNQQTKQKKVIKAFSNFLLFVTTKKSKFKSCIQLLISAPAMCFMEDPNDFYKHHLRAESIKKS